MKLRATVRICLDEIPDELWPEFEAYFYEHAMHLRNEDVPIECRFLYQYSDEIDTL